ncbi:hypothetical protein GJR96_11585 [Haloferax sp. MBLA0076]|uniref:Uncharacterized protein n=1 Tax=Haloferax litoreum TaxID=2666140 RepID=A0A6A8GHE2_9EURY|nr:MULTISPECIES: hypothetical protein [Haloferax]KAB1194044.1 hypothetical protein Hfx1148_11535 [Haloferax sp. CBA1148]MRX22593.1 hypothetical protein [Haloferax litoreum]
MSSYSAPALVAVFVVGVVLGGATVAFVTPTEMAASPTSSISSGTGCLAADESSPASWVGRTPAGEQTTFVFNRTFTHETPSVRIDGTIENPEDGVYIYRVTATPEEDDKPPSDDCTPRTTMDAVVSIPSDHESFTVTFNGEEMVTLENEHSAPLFRTLEG